MPIPNENFPNEVEVIEVGPRDGLQNEPTPLNVDQKERFIKDLYKAGHKVIEVTSFVRPDRVPQMADGLELFKRVRDLKNVRLPCLVPNEKGLERAMDAQVKEVSVFTAASETFNKKNINATISESFERIKPVVQKSLDAGLRVRGYLSTAFGCPYEGFISPSKVHELFLKLLDLGITEVSLGDTIGSGTPYSVDQVLKLFEAKHLKNNVALHFHDTRSLAASNVLVGLIYGVRRYDSSSAGLGGCPYARGATGNLATEDLLYLLNGLSIKSGLDFGKQIEASQWILNQLQLKSTSKVLEAYVRGGDSFYFPKGPQDV